MIVFGVIILAVSLFNLISGLGSFSLEKELELIESRNEICSRWNDNQPQASDIPRTRKKRFLAFPRRTSLILASTLTAPVSNVPGLKSLVFFAKYNISLSYLFPLPIIITTTTVAPSTKPPHSQYGVPPSKYPHHHDPYRQDGSYGSMHHHDYDHRSSHETNEMESTESFHRIPFYEYLEHLLNSRGYHGRQCVLRTLCEVADTPFDHGLFGEIVNLVMSASMNPEEAGIYDDYTTAEYYGKHYGNCHKIYPQCPESVLEIISGVN